MEGYSGGGGAAGWNAGLSGSAPPPFLSKTYDMVDDPSTDAIVSWGPGDNGFVVWNAPEFARDLLPKYFKHNNFSSFVRQLNTYGFRKIDADRWEFASEGFSKGQKHSLKRIDRRKPSHAPSQPQRLKPQNASVAACVEVGKVSLEEETERLKRGKNVLTQELGRLRQHQQTTDLQLQTLGQRLQGMEQRQQQMMSFLANAMQSPGFLAQLVQQNDGNRCIAISNKKRRLPNQEVDSYGKITSPDGLIIKYQPLLHEAARAMLMQIMKMDSSPRLSNSDGLLLENFPPLPDAMDVRSSSGQDLGVTLEEVPPNTANRSSSAVSEIQSSSVADMITAAELPDIYALSSVPEVIAPSQISVSIPQFPQIQVVPAGNIVDISSEYYVVPEVESLYTDPVSVRMNASVPNETKDLLYDEGEKLPCIVDPFWEQFLLMTSGDAEEVDDSSIEEEEEMDAGVSGWNSALNVDHLMEQMGLFTSDTNG